MNNMLFERNTNERMRFFGFSVMFSIVLGILSYMLGNLLGSNTALNFSLEIGANIILIALIFILSKYFEIKMSSTITFNGKIIVRALFYTLIMFIVSNIIVNLLPTELPTQDELTDVYSTVNKVLFFVSVVILAPIVEEILYRFIIIGTFGEKHLYLGIVVSSVLFAFAHRGEGIGGFLVYFSMGSILGLVYKKYKSLELVVLIHILNNLIAYALIF